jgi:hypothetical protein
MTFFGCAWIIYLEFHQFHRPFSISRNLLVSVSHVVLFSPWGGGVVVYGFEQCLNSSLHPPLIFFVSQVKVCELICQAVSSCVGFLGWMKFKARGPWIAVGALGPSRFSGDFAVGHIAWGVTSKLTIFVSHHSSAFLRDIHQINSVTQLTDLVHAESLVSCHNFLSIRVCFNSRCRPGRLLFMSDCVTLLVASLYAEATEAVKSRSALSASTPELVSILGDNNFEARLWNQSQSVNSSVLSERFLIWTWSGMWNFIGRWSESKIWDYMSNTLTFCRPQYPAGEWVGRCGAEISNSLKLNKAMSFSPEGFETVLFHSRFLAFRSPAKIDYV